MLKETTRGFEKSSEYSSPGQMAQSKTGSIKQKRVTSSGKQKPGIR